MKQFRKDDFSEFVLAGDISGTNTSISIAGVKDKKPEPLFVLRFKSQELPIITDAINETLKFAADKHGIHVSKACISAAGPVNPERTSCKLTNLPWQIDVKKILSGTMLNSIALINDFEAIGFGIPFLNEKDNKHIVYLKHPENRHPVKVDKAVKGVIGAGTGLGKSIIIYCDKKGAYMPIASEGGHEDLAVVDAFEYELMQFAKDRRGGEAPLDCEDIISGRGIVAIYDYIIEMEIFEYNSVSKEIESAEFSEKAEMISKHAKKDAACKKTMEIFARFYARALRNTALNVMARGGMYIAGGIAAKNLDFFTDGEFMKEFETNHTQNKVLKDIPVFIVTNYDVSLYGTANVAANFPEMAIKK